MKYDIVFTGTCFAVYFMSVFLVTSYRPIETIKRHALTHQISLTEDELATLEISSQA